MSKKKSTRTQGHKSIRTLITCTLMIYAIFCQGSANIKADNTKKDSGIQVYLPREVTIKDSNLSLGRVSIIRGQESLVAKASEIALGRLSVPGQKIVIDRAMVLSRLVCNGIPASKVTFTGAEKITVRKQEQIIRSSELVKLASSFLEKNPPAVSVCEFNPIRKPKDFIITGTGKDIRFSPRLVQNRARNQARVEITILSGGKKIGVREVIFRLKYNFRQAVTKVNIPTGAIISPENVKIEKRASNNPEPADWKPPYGLIAKRQIPANTVLRPNILGPVMSPIITKRNQKVLIRIDRPGFLITVFGKAMQDGRAGEYIKVRNVDSQRIILVKIKEDGSVEPVF
ncbi:MAG: flagellar basal body P-ring formation protein FlgA [Planctomycetes bacterium]|nr:flagellar basal body P-ring formation protein FlgA [Planctomycetota bacterium]MCH8118456.1 flagellar basal body P-ring formation protein FlgA [Planctomycetota bacterium]